MAWCQTGNRPLTDAMMTPCPWCVLSSLNELERLRSEDTPRRPMITPYYWPVYFESQVHINDQFISDPKSKQGESRKIRKFAKNWNFRILL